MPRTKKIEMPLRFDRRGIFLRLKWSKGLNRNPDIYEKAGAFRHPRRRHFGAIIASVNCGYLFWVTLTASGVS